MDARLDPAKYAGLSEGDAHVIRNAGGRASDDAIRSLVISHKLLGQPSGLLFIIQIVV
jgi:carbonic anhydrase